MKTISTVFRKELIDTIRDRRTLMFMVVIPLLLFPVLFKVMFSIQKSKRDEQKARVLQIACITNENAPRLIEIIGTLDDMEIVPGVHADSIRSFIASDSLDGAFVLSSDFDNTVAELGAGRIDLYYKSAGDEVIVRNRLRKVIENYEDELLASRFESLDLDKTMIEGVDLRTYNVASMEEQFGKQVGGFLPYIFILFCFMGAMYPAIDLGAGEKERGTLETLLTAPVNRLHILIGKFGVVVVSGVLSACVSMVGLYLGVRQSSELPEEFMSIVVKILGMDTILLVLSLLIPLTIFFSGILLTISFSAKSFKEAQSMITPLNMAIIVPAAIGMIPGMEMNFAMSIVPVLNVSLATREIIAGTITSSQLVAVFVSLIVFAMASLMLASTWFRRESTIFRH